MVSIKDRFKGAWNAFSNEEKRADEAAVFDHGPSLGMRPDRRFFSGGGGERTVIASIYNRLSIDIASISIRHVIVNENGWYQKDYSSELNRCLSDSANIDQGARAFRQDMAHTLFEQGVIAVVPVDTDHDINTGAFDVRSLRIGRITQWYPRFVKVELYNDRTGLRQEVTVSKDSVAIVENPLFSVMNEKNSTLQRLIRKLHMLDAVDEQTSSGKLDLLIQLPYAVKSEQRREQARKRTKDVEVQLKGSKYGIAYIDGTENITQLNRPAENNLLKQVEYLTAMLYGQLGLTEEVFNGTADEQTMLNYHNRTIEPILESIVEEFRRKFLTRTARTQKQSIEFFREPFKLVSVGNVAEIADKFTRNEIMTSNEIRSVIGFKPSDDPKANELHNSNLSRPSEEEPVKAPPTEE